MKNEKIEKIIDSNFDLKRLDEGEEFKCALRDVDGVEIRDEFLEDLRVFIALII